MIVLPADLTCPIDGMPLVVVDTARRCPEGHVFDIAREGYCNLLLVQHKASRDPGDSKEMVAARHRFLAAGHFAPIAEAVGACVLGLLPAKPDASPTTVLDAGCGEGYYLAHLAKQIIADPRPRSAVALAGIDISKWAIRQAARRPEPITWAVASNRRPPFTRGSVNVILCLFGFPIWEGFSPVQVAGHHVVLVDPAIDHLIELREIIYPTVARQALAPFSAAALAAGYSLMHEQSVGLTTHLPDAQAVQDLLAMTPHAHRVTQASRAKLATVTSLTVTVDVMLCVLVKRF